MNRVHNFCAGPAALPTEVLQKAQQEILDWQGKGLSVMEMSHRSDEFVAIAEKAEQDLRQLLSIPLNYKVLFLQGGASLQFSAVPMNLLGQGDVADYIDTGIWSKKAIDEAKRYGQVNVAYSAKDNGYVRADEGAQWQLSDSASYVHYCANETIGGLQLHSVPKVTAPLVADLSSNILSEPLDVSQFGLIYAGAQKNIGPAGLTIVIVREDLLGAKNASIPQLLDYQLQAKNGSMINTPPTYSWYLAGLVFEWLLAKGGLTTIAEENHKKASTLYDFIDASGFYANPIDPTNRSIMNVPFTLADSQLDSVFLKESNAAGLLNLAGHRSVGGMRASIYNAVSIQAVNDLVSFMADFSRRYG